MQRMCSPHVSNSSPHVSNSTNKNIFSKIFEFVFYFCSHQHIAIVRICYFASKVTISYFLSTLHRFIAQPVGTHWYHSHLGFQRSDGLFGALIVKPKNQEEGMLFLWQLKSI